MPTTKTKTIKMTRESVEGTKETSVEVEIGTNESLDAVPARIDEVVATVDDLLAHDEKFRGLDIYQQAEYLEMGYIFGTLPGTAGGNQHFARQQYLDLLIAHRDGKVQDIKARALAKEAAEPVEENPDEKPLGTGGKVIGKPVG